MKKIFIILSRINYNMLNKSLFLNLNLKELRLWFSRTVFPRIISKNGGLLSSINFGVFFKSCTKRKVSREVKALKMKTPTFQEFLNWNQLKDIPDDHTRWQAYIFYIVVHCSGSFFFFKWAKCLHHRLPSGLILWTIYFNV